MSAHVPRCPQDRVRGLSTGTAACLSPFCLTNRIGLGAGFVQGAGRAGPLPPLPSVKNISCISECLSNKILCFLQNHSVLIVGRVCFAETQRREKGGRRPRGRVAAVGDALYVSSESSHTCMCFIFSLNVADRLLFVCVCRPLRSLEQDVVQINNSNWGSGLHFGFHRVMTFSKDFSDAVFCPHSDDAMTAGSTAALLGLLPPGRRTQEKEVAPVRPWSQPQSPGGGRPAALLPSQGGCPRTPGARSRRATLLCVVRAGEPRRGCCPAGVCPARGPPGQARDFWRACVTHGLLSRAFSTALRTVGAGTSLLTGLTHFIFSPSQLKAVLNPWFSVNHVTFSPTSLVMRRACCSVLRTHCGGVVSPH